jgi:CheY-like chemotaxis protein
VSVSVFKTEARTSGPAIGFSVADSGIGIPESHLRSIFNAFEQVDSSIGRKYGGTGLGLAISSNLAALLGGEIKVASQVGQGTTFTLVLPVSVSADRAEESAALRGKALGEEPASARKAPERTVSPGPASDNQILIIEDDLKFARILADLAEEEGLRPMIACDGSEGLEQALARLPACILLDYRLPRLDGLKILKELKANPSTRHIPVYMISIDDQGLEAQKLGAMGYLLKPAEPERIRQILRRMKATASGRTRNVLVVEDNEVQRGQVIETIGNGSVRVTGVATAREALDALKEGTAFDCMVLDLSLPDMSGFELLEKIYEGGSIQVPPVVVNTARSLSREEEEKLRRYSETIIIKGAHSSERLLDEVSLFTHRIVGKMPAEMRKKVEDLYRPESAFRGKNVLLVDDEVRNIFALSSALEGTGLKVTVARNGREALEMLESLPRVDLVLMDIMMPVMDGYEAMKRIRGLERFKRLPVIALTAKAMKEDRRLCLEAGASDYLAKPVDIDRLFSLLRVWLGG